VRSGGRLIASGAVAAWSSVADIADAAMREDARAMLRESLLDALVHGRQIGTRVSPAVPALRPALSPLVGEPSRETAIPDIRPVVSELSQLVA
jgi:hypothetical protein